MATNRFVASETAGDLNVVGVTKGAERYIFLYDRAGTGDVLRTLGHYASNPELSFSWYDAAALSQRIRHLAAKEQA